MMLLLLFDDKKFIIESKFHNSALHCRRKKENKNIGLDFPISIENWLNTIVRVRVDMVLGPVYKEGGGGNSVVLP